MSYPARAEGLVNMVSRNASIDQYSDSKNTFKKKKTAKKNSLQQSKNRKITNTRKQKLKEKQLYRYFKLQTCKIAREKMQTWLREGNLKRETESLLIVAQNNAIRTNYVKVKIDKTQLNQV